MPIKSKRRTRKISDPVEASIFDLKKEVRKKVSRGEALSKRGVKLSNLESREIQIKIAGLETKAAEASIKDKNSPSTAQRVLKQMQALKRKLES